MTRNSAKGVLSDNVVLGNIFVVNLAGIDTIAIILSFIMMLLSAHPEVQDWLYEEISTVTHNRRVEEWDYAMFLK